MSFYHVLKRCSNGSIVDVIIIFYVAQIDTWSESQISIWILLYDPVSKCENPWSNLKVFQLMDMVQILQLGVMKLD